MSQLGRISGPLLKANLVRDGVDLAFETDLLYLDVTNSRIGIRTDSPDYDLDVNGTVKSNTLEVTNQLDIGSFTFNTNTISSSTNTINLLPSGGEGVVYQARLLIDDFEISANTISTTVSNSNIELRPNGSGIIELFANTAITGNLNVSGNVDVTGNVTIGGNIVIGDSLTDNVTINASIQSDLIPRSDDTYDLGSPGHRWRNAYVNNLYTDVLNISALNIGNFIFEDNEIRTTSSQDMRFDGSGAGRVIFGNFAILDNQITNIVSGSITEIIQTGTGYFKLGDTTAFVPPVGSDIQRPTAYAEIGMTRYNTDSKSLEVWDGADWASPAGASGAVNEITANEIAAIYAITLG